MTSLKMSDVEFKMSLDKYYKLKSKYEAPYKKFVDGLIKNDQLTVAEKRDSVASFKKKCVKCGSLGGTVFKQEANLLTATCGNTHNKCKLNMRIQKQPHENIVNVISTLNDEIDENKINTIQTKLDFLFGFTDESTTIAKFNNLKAELIASVKEYQIIYTEYLNIIDDLPKKQQIKLLEDGLYKLIKKFKLLIANYRETMERTYLVEANDLYLNSIVKIAETIRNLKYVNSSVEDNDDGTRQLIQEGYGLRQLHMKHGILSKPH